jgi:hypothetical protein
MSDKRLDVVATTMKNLGTGASEGTTAISQIPIDINSITKTAIIATARQQALHGGVSESLNNVVEKLSQEEIANGTISALSNFKPAVLQGNAIQRRNIGSVEGSIPITTRSTARATAIAGLDPATQAIRDQIAKLQQLADTKNMLSAQANALLSQMGALTSKLNALNLDPSKLQQYQQQLDILQATYNKTVDAIDAIRKAYDLRYETWRKLKLDYRDAKKKLNKTLDNYYKLLQLPEIPTSINWPKLPKLPNINFSKADFKQQVSNLVTAIVNASKEASKTSLENSRKQNQPKIESNPPKPEDFFTTAVSTAKKALGAVEARVNAFNAAKQAAIDTAAGALTAEINRGVAGVALAQQRIASNIGNLSTQVENNIANIQQAKDKADTFKKGMEKKFDTLAQDTANLIVRANAGLQSASAALTGEQVGVDITANTPVTSNPIYTVDEQTKLDALQANITAFLSAGAHKNFTVGVGKGNTLRAALNQSLKLQEFKTEFPLAFTNNLYDKRNEISNINGVYLVVTAVYQTVPIIVPAPPAPQPPTGTTAAITITASDDILSVVDVGPGYNIVVMSGGNTVKRTGTFPWRNFNPGNIENGSFATEMGALKIPNKGAPSRYAVFPNYQTGRNAMKQLLQSSTYNRLLVSTAIAKWAPAVENNTAAYQAKVINAIGTDSVVGSLTDTQLNTMMDAIETAEGYRTVGTITTIASGAEAAAPTAAPPVTPTVSTIAVPDAASAILDIYGSNIRNANLPRKDYTKLDSIMSIIETGLSNGKTYSSEVMARYNSFKAYFKKLDADRLNSDINNQESILGNDKSQLDSAKIRLDADPTEAVYQTVYNNRLREYNQSLSYLNELKAKKSSMG